jgi:hypothetical protein
MKTFLAQNESCAVIHNQIHLKTSQLARLMKRFNSNLKNKEVTIKHKIYQIKRNFKEGVHYNYVLPSELPRNGKKVLPNNKTLIVRNGNTGMYLYTAEGVKSILESFAFTMKQIQEFIFNFVYFSYSKLAKKRKKLFSKTFDYLHDAFVDVIYVVFNESQLITNRILTSLIHSR